MHHSSRNITDDPIKQFRYQYPSRIAGAAPAPGYLWWNGYIHANQITSVDANGKPNGYMGVPAEYDPVVRI